MLHARVYNKNVKRFCEERNINTIMCDLKKTHLPVFLSASITFYHLLPKYKGAQ